MASLVTSNEVVFQEKNSNTSWPIKGKAALLDFESL
jgi:hypothetical protein